MKYIKLVPLFLAGCLMAACSDWTDQEVSEPTDMVNSIKSSTYYGNLRAYKARHHAVTYAKWAGWTGTGSVLNTQLVGLPDSLDIVGLVDGYEEMTEDKRTDLLAVQQKKGTKVVMTVSSEKLVADLGGDELDFKADKYAEMLVKEINDAGLDGVDIELRKQDGSESMGVNPMAIEALLKKLSASFGPSAKNGKLLILSGDPKLISADLASLFDYIVAYAFGSTTDQTLDAAFLSLTEHFSSACKPEELAGRLILMEDFQTNSNGGVLFKDRFANTMFSLEGMARWLPIVGGRYVDKGGVGVYHLETEYVKDGHIDTYPFMHNAIQILNPTIK